MEYSKFLEEGIKICYLLKVFRGGEAGCSDPEALGGGLQHTKHSNGAMFESE